MPRTHAEPLATTVPTYAVQDGGVGGAPSLGETEIKPVHGVNPYRSLGSLGMVWDKECGSVGGGDLPIVLAARYLPCAARLQNEPRSYKYVRCRPSARSADYLLQPPYTTYPIVYQPQSHIGSLRWAVDWTGTGLENSVDTHVAHLITSNRLATIQGITLYHVPIA